MHRLNSIIKSKSQCCGYRGFSSCVLPGSFAPKNQSCEKNHAVLRKLNQLGDMCPEKMNILILQHFYNHL